MGLVNAVVSTECPSGPAAVFDMNKHVSLFPVFPDSAVESYIGAFERTAAALHSARRCVDSTITM